VDFNELDAEALTFLAVEDYLRLRKASPAEFQVYQLWYLALHPLKIAEDKAARVMAQIFTVFPGIESADHKTQIEMGRRILFDALDNPDLAEDLRTERSDSFGCKGWPGR
jgi:hypothetical protein